MRTVAAYTSANLKQKFDRVIGCAYVAGDQAMLGQINAKSRQLEFFQLGISHLLVILGTRLRAAEVATRFAEFNLNTG